MTGEITENTVRVIAEEVCKDKMDEVCILKHDKIVGDITTCLNKKFADFYRKGFWTVAIATFILLVGQIIIKEIWR